MVTSNKKVTVSISWQKLLNEKKLHETENLYLDFETPEKANQL